MGLWPWTPEPCRRRSAYMHPSLTRKSTGAVAVGSSVKGDCIQEVPRARRPSACLLPVGPLPLSSRLLCRLPPRRVVGKVLLETESYDGESMILLVSTLCRPLLFSSSYVSSPSSSPWSLQRMNKRRIRRRIWPIKNKRRRHNVESNKTKKEKKSKWDSMWKYPFHFIGDNKNKQVTVLTWTIRKSMAQNILLWILIFLSNTFPYSPSGLYNQSKWCL